MIVVIFSLRATIYYVLVLIVFNKNVDIKFSAHDTFLEYPSLCILQILAHLGCQSNVFPGPLTDLSTWVGFCTSIPH